MRFRGFAVALCVPAASAVLAGCVDMNAVAASPDMTNRFQHVSAGYTGCYPADNVISHQDMAWGGTWQATCKGKTYLCTSSAVNGGGSMSCAPLAQ